MAGADYREVLDFTKEMIRFLAEKLRVPREVCDVSGEWQIFSVRDAFRAFANEDADRCAEEEARFETVLVEQVEPKLPKDVPCVLIDYPIRFGAFAVRRRRIRRWRNGGRSIFTESKSPMRTES